MQPSFVKGNDNDMTRATLTHRNPAHSDMSILINKDTSRQARGIINKLNSEMRNRPEMVNVSHADSMTNFLSKDDSVNRSTTLIRGAHNILGLSHDPLPQISPIGRPTSRSIVDQSAMLSKSSTSRIGSASQVINPNVDIRNRGLKNRDVIEVNNHLAVLERKEKAEKVKKYIESVVEKVEKLESHQKDFKQYEKAELDAKDDEIRKWVIEQKKVDEERRVEIETRLRTIFQDKIIEGTGYSPSEGFLLSIDFM